ncbi:thioredoxin fold domain-containing protein [Acidithiobacillus sp.]|uniref:thioredoxin fold domain-containing protein n=1 Tax=Acidithiobacillus sp. TaxID=1872118 RepID=UPI0034263C94
MMASHLTYIQSGHGGPIIYDFTDTNCSYCHILYNAEEHLVREGRLTVRYVPVAMIDPSSMSEAVYILQAKSPAAVLSNVERIIGDNMENKNHITLPQVAHIIDNPFPRELATIKEIELNNGFLHEIKVDQLPDIIYQRSDGHLGLITGLIGKEELTSILAESARVQVPGSGNADGTIAPILMGKNDE